MAKQFSRSAQIGEEGVALIGRLAAAMGFIWHPHRVDHGIDGHVELVDPGSGNALNRLLLVQSKAQEGPFPGEDERSFHYVCKPQDIDYWMGGNAPVILVCSHPSSDEAWWVSIKDAFADPARRKARRADFDKQRDRFDTSAASNLMRLAVPADASTYLPAPPRPEQLSSNLLQVERFAETVSAAPAVVRHPREAIELLRRKGEFCSDWILTDGMVWSFRRVDEPPLSHLIDGNAEEHPTAEWQDSKDVDVRRRFVRLLNQTLVEITHRELRRHRKGFLYFRPTDGLEPRRVSTPRSKRGRVVFQAYPHRDDPDRIRWCRHHALEHQFLRLDEAWYLALRPTYHFSFDGYRDVPWGPDLAAEMKRRERNPAVRGLVRFWARYLRIQPTLFDRPDWRLQFGELATVSVERGIDDATWGRFELATSTAGSDPTLFEDQR